MIPWKKRPGRLGGLLLVGIAVTAALAGGSRLAAATHAGSAPRLTEAAAAPGSPAAQAKVNKAFGKLPLTFIENRGQVDARVAYYVQGRDTSLYFTARGLTLALARPETTAGEKLPREKAGARRWALKLDFVGARAVRPAAAAPTGGVVSYFTGPKEAWQAGLKTYGQLVYRDLWPGIDLAYSGTVNRLKYEFVVRPGADPQRIRLAYRGATGARVTGAGKLEVTTPAGAVQDDRPYAYQEVEGKRVTVPARYVLGKRQGRGSKHARPVPIGYHFALGAYDRSRPLVLDPAVLVYCGYLGGAGEDYGYDIAVDNLGNAYVTGSAYSNQAAFPVTGGPDLTHNGGSSDAFVAKVNAAGTGLDYCGYIGGTGREWGYGIAVDSLGNAYVTGFTDSNQASFPVTGGPDLTFNGGGDAFVAKVNAAGTGLDYCGYIGGAGNDEGHDIAVDSLGNAYVSGYTYSNEASFPVTGGPDLTHNGGSSDAFVAKVNAAGTGLDYCGYIGGAGREWGYGIAVDSLGNAYVTGFTDSNQASFPVTGGPDLTFNGGLYDAFMAKVNAAGTGLDYCGYIGGSGYDDGGGIALDSLGNAYVTGNTTSNQASFPVTGGPDLTHNGEQDAFVAKVNAAGTGLDYCGYIGGFGLYENGNSIAVDSLGNAYVTGTANSNQASFPVTGGPDLTFNGGDIDAFVAKVNAAGTGLDYCGYIGGTGREWGFGIAVDSLGNAYVTGSTGSNEASFPVTGGPDLTFSGYRITFVAKIGAASPAYTLTPSATSVQPGAPLSISWTAPAGRPSSDWIGLYRVGDPNTAFRWYRYTSGLQSGSFTLAAPGEAGQYEFRYLLQDGYNEGARSTAVTVTAPASSYTLTASPATVTPGGPINVSWTAPAGRPGTDWIGLFRVGDPNSAFRWYTYTAGLSSGTFTLPAPQQPGQYEFRYLLQDGYTDAARSGTVTVN